MEIDDLPSAEMRRVLRTQKPDLAKRIVAKYVEACPKAKRAIEAFFNARGPDRLARMIRRFDSN